MKYVVILPDGMADDRYEQLNNKSPLEFAKTPTMDFIAQNGVNGLTKNVPEGMPPGSDVAIMSVMSYNPKKYYMSRGPLEAVSLEIPFSEDDIIFRCNNVKIENNIMVSSNANHIKTSESKKIIEFFDKHNKFDGVKIYPGTAYRHIILIDSKKYPELDYMNLDCTPPHDIVNQNVLEYKPKGKGADLINKIQLFSQEILKEYNEKNNSMCNTLWLWGQGKIKNMLKFEEKFHIKGSVISAVDLIKGLGKFVGLKSIDVEGATGYYDTNFEGKTAAAIEAIKKDDFVFVHLEAPDEAGHDGNLQKKIEMIEVIDEKVVTPIFENLKENYNDFRILILPDHPTPITLRTHTSEPVPFILYDNKLKLRSGFNFSEFNKVSEKNKYENGYLLLENFIKDIQVFI